MTLANQIIYAERRARVSSNATTISAASDVTTQYINEGTREFCKLVGGLPKRGYLDLSPKFDVQTNWAMRMTITGGANALTVQDMALAATNHTSLTGGSLAAYLGGEISNNLALSVSVSWDSDLWEFTFYDEAAAATHWEIASPSNINYVDAVDHVLNKSGTQTGTYFTGDIPMDCVVETALPSDCLSVEAVEWNGSPLLEAPYELFISPQEFGTPRWYAIKGAADGTSVIRVSPVPEEQEMFVLQYKSMPDDLTTTTQSCPLPTAYHFAPIYYAAHMLAQDNNDWTVSQQSFALFMNEVGKYRCKTANQNFTMFPRRSDYRPIKVVL